MKKSKILLYALLALPVMSLQSCLKDQEDVFDEPSSTRLNEYLQQTKSTLTSSENGWIFDYYPEASQSYGGSTYTVQFAGNDECAVRSEYNPDDGDLTSLYSMKADDGPVLSFDTYNAFIHEAATPNGDSYQGQEGDFEFVIDSIGTDSIKVHGKRTLNTMYLRRLNEPAEDYVTKVADMGDSWITAEADLTIGGQPYYFVITSLSNRQIAIYDGNGSLVTRTAYNFTDKGIDLYKPIMLSGVRVQEINYDDANLTLSADGVSTTKIYVDPVEAVALIGNISTGNASVTRTFNIPHLDQYTFTADADWVHISTDGNTLTIRTDANPDASQVRRSTVTVTNGDYSSSFTVLQMELDALLGTYRMSLHHYIGSFVDDVHNVTLGYEDNNLYLTITDYEDGTIKIPCIWLDSQKALLIRDKQSVGTLQGSSSSYDLAPVFLFGGGSYYTPMSSYYFYDMLNFESDANGNITTSLLGQLLVSDGQQIEALGYPVEEFWLGAYPSGSDFSGDSYAGWADRFTNTSMVMTAHAASSARASVPASVKKSTNLPSYLKKGIKTVSGDAAKLPAKRVSTQRVSIK